MSSVITIVSFGEILWDSTPKGLFLGGAPANVAYHLGKLGVRSLPVSAVGADYLGEEIRRRVLAWGIDPQHIGSAPKRTGVVQVDLSDPSAPTYDIVDDVAWDYIPSTASLAEELKSASAFVFGSLSLRHKANQEQLESLLSQVQGLKVFDVNLRPPFYNTDQVRRLAEMADLVKVNVDELEILHPFAVGSLEVMAATFSALLGGKKVCVTCGSVGAGYWDGGSWSWAEARPVKKGDAVGAGDAFLAGLLYGLTRELPIDLVLNNACRLAELVAASDGAQPSYDPSPFTSL